MPQFSVSVGMLGHATVSPEVLEGMQLLELAEKQVLRLGKHGVELVLKLSQAWFRSAPQHTEKESATAFRYTQEGVHLPVSAATPRHN